MLKQSLIFALLLMGCLTMAVAENYPYRSDFLWVTHPNHADWLYKGGEKATVEVQLYRYGVPVEATIQYETGDDLQPADGHGTATLREGRAIIALGTRRTPGFRDLRLTATVNGQTTRHHIKVGYDVDRITPYTQEPADFLQFWQKSVDQLRSRQWPVTMEDAPEYTTPKMTCRLLRLQVDAKHCVYAYLFVPKDAKVGSCPAVLCPPGAGIKTIKEPLRHRYYGEGGCIRMEMEIHGLDPRLPQQTFDDLSHAFNPSNDEGYLAHGLGNRENYYMRHVYLALVRCLDYLTTLPEWDGRNLAVQGGSQGGALAIVAAALDGRVTQCIVNHPALSDMCAYADPGRTGGYPHFKPASGTLTAAAQKTLPYYDVVNFARHVKATVFMTWGFNDNTCPPTTSYAVWNTLTCPKECLITPINEHWTSDATDRTQYDWLMSHLK